MEAGFALFNQLLALPVHLSTYNIGSVNSVANVIFLAGKTRVASPSATFLLHETFWGIPNATQMRHAQVNEISESLLAEDARLKKTILSRTTFEKEALDRLILKGSTLTAEDALKYKMIDRIEELKIPDGGELIQI